MSSSTAPSSGPFEASFHLAAQLGSRVGVVTILDSVVPMLDRLAWSMGQSVRYAGATAIDIPVLELKNDPARVVSLVVDAGLDLIARREADVLVLGCMSLSFLGVAEQARERIGMPVINPAMCALKTAEALVAQQLKPSRRTLCRPSQGRLHRGGDAMNNGMTRKQFLQTALWGGVSALVAPRELGAWQVSGPPLDVVIKNGRVIDGTGRAAFEAAVGIRGGVIADIGVIPDSAARQVIDAKGQYVCPGFIDPHAHEEILMVADPVLEKFVRQGVTTLVNGNCGHSVTPYRAKTVLEYWYREALISKKRSLMKVDWEGVDGYAKVIAGIGATINSAVLLGYGGIRWGAMHGGHDRPPTDAEWKEIERLVAMGLEQGAVGMSTGLAYRPCFYAKTDELIRVAQILAKHDKVYASHLRNGPNGASKRSRSARRPAAACSSRTTATRNRRSISSPTPTAAAS